MDEDLTPGQPPADEPADDTADERPARPVPIGVPPATTVAAEAPAYPTSGEVAGQPGVPPPPDERPDVEDPATESWVGVAAAVLAGSVFLPWYRSIGGFDITGWASGTWGPIVFFLALAALAVVALRRAGVAVAFPISHALMLEGIGWISVLALLLKRFARPEGFNVVGVSANPFAMGFWVALVAGVALALLASKLSKNAPIVLLPGWFRGRAGKVGAGVVALSLVAGVAFGMANDAGSALEAARRGTIDASVGGLTPQLQEGLPECIGDAGFPVPRGITPVEGFGRDEPTQLCTAIFSGTAGVGTIQNAFTRSLDEASWEYSVLDATAANPNTRMLAITAPQCGTLQIVQAGEDRRITVVLSPDFCQSLQQLPGGQSSN